MWLLPRATAEVRQRKSVSTTVEVATMQAQVTRAKICEVGDNVMDKLVEEVLVKILTKILTEVLPKLRLRTWSRSWTALTEHTYIRVRACS